MKGSDYNIPRTFEGDLENPPAGYTVGEATQGDLADAGFRHAERGEPRKPGEAPLDELLVSGQQTITMETARRILAESWVYVLRDGDGRIVATWDEGRWWTPDESAEFLAALLAEAKR
jgi:hypothetical protein